MGVVRVELARLLDADDPLVGRDEREEGGEERRLAGAGAAGDEDVRAPRDEAAQHRLPRVRDGAARDEVVEPERPGPQDAQRDDGPRRAHGRDDGVQARPVREAGVDDGRRGVGPLPARRGGAARGRPAGGGAAGRGRGAGAAGAAVDPHVVGPVDEHVRHAGLVEVPLERPGPEDLRVGRPGQLAQRGRAEHPARRPQRVRDGRVAEHLGGAAWVVARPHEAVPDPVEQGDPAALGTRRLLPAALRPVRDTSVPTTPAARRTRLPRAHRAGPR